MDNVSSDNEEQKAHHIIRIADLDNEPFDVLPPISGYEDMALVSLEAAVEPLVPFLPDIENYAFIAKQRCRKTPVDRLSNDESASIMLYTMGWKPLDQCLYIVLNKTLRLKERKELEPWFLYLKLFLTALSRLPSIHQNIYREIELDLSEQYKIGETIVWWGFSSCTTSIDHLQVLNTRTLFTIECFSGKNIRPHSYFQLEDEILLFPHTQFQIQAYSNESIQLLETHPSSPLLYPLSTKSLSNKLIYIGDYEFNGVSSTGELSFRKGDQLEILDRYSRNEWWKAKNFRTKQIGYVPADYISAIIDLTAYEWYFTETNRHDAEQLLQQEHNGKGTFLIRPSDTYEDEESMSILDFNKERYFHVKHYRIRRTDQGLFYLNKKKVFSSLQDLVNYYQKIYGLCCLLKYPYQKIESIISINQYGLSELDRSQLVSTELLHRGNDNEIYKGTYGQRDVIIKYMNMDNQNNINQFLDQTKIMKEFSHKNLVHFYGVCTQDKPILIVTEFMIHGCLLKYLRDQSRINLKLKTIVDFIRQIINGMSYLEEKGYVHCDLAARNVFIGEFDIVKIGGFHSIKILQNDRLIIDEESQFPMKWIAPEVITNKEYTMKSHIWSFGILLYELITYGSNPYPQFSDDQILQLILNGYRMYKPNDCHEEYYQIMHSCWQENPDDRPTFEILSMRFDEFIKQDEPINQNETYTEFVLYENVARF